MKQDLIDCGFLREFVERYSSQDVKGLRLKYSSSTSRDLYGFAIDQIESRRRFSNKIRPFLEKGFFLFPTVLAGEQASHSSVAFYNSKVAGKVNSLLDMTAGLGIDTMTMALNSAAMVTAVDIEPFKRDVLIHNLKELEIENVEALADDSIEFLKKCDRRYDLIFVDPARRSDDGSRVFAFDKCQPDIISSWEMIADKSDRVLIKASPMIDITQALVEIPDVKSIHVVCVKGECKELLIESENKTKSDSQLESSGISFAERDVEIKVVNLEDDGETISEFSFRWSERHKSSPIYTGDDFAGKFLCIPNAGIMKTNAWGAIAEAFPGMKKLSSDTHLFICDELPDSFPGRVLVIEKELNGKALKQLKGDYRNVVSRNHPLSASQLAKKAGVIEGGERYIVGCRCGVTPRPVILDCRP